MCHGMPSASVLACVSLPDFTGEGSGLPEGFLNDPSLQSWTIGGVISGLALAAVLRELGKLKGLCAA